MVTKKDTNETYEDESFASSLLASSQASGVESGIKRTILETLQSKFGADDLVKVKNFTNKRIGWVYADRRGMRIEQPDEYTRRVYQGPQKVRVVRPGQTVVVPGWEAYAGLTRFYKDWVQDAHKENMAVSIHSQTCQAEFLSKAYLGLYDPNEIEEAPKDVKAEVESDLGLTNVKAKA